MKPRPRHPLIATLCAAASLALLPASAAAKGPELPKAPVLGSIAVSDGEFACGVTRAGEGLCWGWDGSRSWPFSHPADARLSIPVGKRWASLSVNQNRGCGITTVGKMFCWGVDHGMGEGNTPPGHTWLSVSVTAGRTCGVDSNHDAFCWGESRFAPVPAGNKWRSVEAHDTGGCGVTVGDQAGCWTENAFHESDLPALAAFDEWSDITTAYTTTCGVSNKGAGYCWGQTNDRGQRAVPAGKTWKRIDAGDSSSCGVTTNGEGYCWGLFPSVNAVPAGKQWSAISVADNGLACGITTTGEGLCWGQNEHGQTVVPAGKFTALSIPLKPLVKWAANMEKLTATATITAARENTYTLTAKLGRKIKTGKCTAKGKKVICTLKTGKGKWALAVTPSNALGTGKANSKVIKF